MAPSGLIMLPLLPRIGATDTLFYASRGIYVLVILAGLDLEPKYKTTRNAARCNNRDDSANLSFTLKVSVFSEAYLEPSRTSIMKRFSEIAESRTLSGLTQILATESPLKLMKNAFYFILKSNSHLPKKFVLFA